MLKFIKSNMSTIAGIEIYPIISLSIFFLFFALMGFLVFTMKKQKLKELSEMPLKD